ncbi:MAG TPA: hypothetical protein VGN34_07220, partial [Ktedonobacteraceae bacterium]
NHNHYRKPKSSKVGESRHRHGRRGRLIERAEVEEEETAYGERKKQQVKSMRVPSRARSVNVSKHFEIIRRIKMQQKTVHQIIEDENQDAQKRTQERINEQAEVELSDAELISNPFNHT